MVARLSYLSDNYIHHMKIRLLSLNCQRALNPNFKSFFQRVLSRGKHRIFLLQEASDSVINVAKKNLEKYKMIQHKTPNGNFSELCILYSKKLHCVESDFLYIEDNEGKNFGILMATFRSKRFSLSTANVHLPAHLKPQKRSEAMEQVKEKFIAFLKKHPQTTRVILAGDFNSILPGEYNHHKSILASFLSPVRNRRSYTYVSDRLEPTDFLSKLIYWLGKIGISFKTSLDYVFANHVLVKRKRVKARSQKKNISDHLPILIEVR